MGMGLWDLLPGGQLHLVSGLVDLSSTTRWSIHRELDHPRAGESDLVGAGIQTEFNLSRAFRLRSF